MSTRKKTLEKWKYNTPVDAPIDSVKAIIDYYFGEFEQNATSHMVIKDEDLKKNGITEIAGFFVIPVSGGQKVKGRYLKRLVEAIEIKTGETI
ncbi:MAG: hypothetical protein ABSD46_06930 [Bacteroidota bacterium]